MNARMQERDNNSKLVSICQRVCRFILNPFLGRGQGLSHETLQSQESHGSSQAAEDEGQLIGTSISSDVEIEFMEGSEMDVGKSGSAKGKQPLVQETSFGNGVRRRDPKIKDSAEEKQTITNSGKEAEDVKTTHKTPRQVSPVIRSVHNIDERSDAFIRRKKETWNKGTALSLKTY